jgi:hypothetical protein
VPFTITLAQFKDWCAKTHYLENTGNQPECATINRINHDEGYHIWNIEILSHAENSEIGNTVPGRDTLQNESQPDYPERSDDYALPDSSVGCDDNDPDPF